MIDRLPPQSIEAEQSVLGSILIDRDAVIEVAEFLKAEDFYRQAHAEIYAVIVDLFERREPIDIVTVAEALERDDDLEADRRPCLPRDAVEPTPTAVHATQYARIVERKALLRNLIGAAGKIAGIGYEDPAEVAGGDRPCRGRAVRRQPAARRRPGFSPLKSLLHDAYDRLDYLHEHRGEISGVRTGFQDLDTLTTGLQKSDLVILAARPSVGKTSFALNIAEHAAVTDRKSVGIFSLEMSKEQLVLRLLSSVANIDSQRLRSGFLEELDFARIAPAMNALSEAPIYIDDTPNITTMELRTKARRLQAESGLDLVIVDYLQLMQSSTTTRDANRVQEVSRDLARAQGARARAQGPGHRPLAAVTPARDAGVEGAAPVRPPRVGLDRAGRGPRDVPVAREGARLGRPGHARARSSSSSCRSTATARPARSTCGSRRRRRGS